jgi:hypothetical protein
MRSFFNHWYKPTIMIISLLLCSSPKPSISTAADFHPVRTSSTGYQPQFQVSGSKIYYVWHEYDGPFRQIFTAKMAIDGRGWEAEKRTSGQYDKVFPQLQVVGNKIYHVRQQPDGTKNRQIWTMEMNIDGTGWKEVQRTNTPFDKQFPQLQVVGDQIVGNKIYYVWHEDHGVTEPIWVAEGTF